MRVVRKRHSVTIDANPHTISSRLSSKQDRGSAPEGLNRTAGGTNGAAATSYSYQKLRSASSSNIPAEKVDQRPSDALRDGFGLHQLAGDGALSQDSIYEDCQSDFDPCELEGLPSFKRRRLLTEGSETYLSCYSVLDPSLYDVVETKDTGEVTIHRRSVSSESIVIVPVQTKLQGPLKERLRVLFKPAWVLLKNGMFYICSLSFVLLYTINVIYNSTVLDFALDKGVAAGSIVSLLSLFSVADLIARLATSVLMNSELGSKKLLMIWVQASSGVLLLAAPYLVGYSAALVAALLLGANLGSLSVLYIILFEDYIGLHLVAWAFGMYGIAMGLLALLMVPIISYCRDLLLSYDTLFQVMGLICLLNVFFWAFAEPFFKKQRAAWFNLHKSAVITSHHTFRSRADTIETRRVLWFARTPHCSDDACGKVLKLHYGCVLRREKLNKEHQLVQKPDGTTRPLCAQSSSREVCVDSGGYDGRACGPAEPPRNI
ncbi:hypothetical protein V5799_002732 [Amblyomma americanum]|uniref:Monocarboxylate transporter n=1 Tax=Amblyomma americanum TaxID=6943 RepID=A0AAQ4DB01_AMBAM